MAGEGLGGKKTIETRVTLSGNDFGIEEFIKEEVLHTGAPIAKEGLL